MSFFGSFWKKGSNGPKITPGQADKYNWIDSINGGRYKFIKPLSINVCVARDINGEIVAIKKLCHGGPDGLPTYDDPQNEIHIHSRLNHSNIVKFVRWHAEGIKLFSVTRYMESESLARRFFLKPGEQKEVIPVLLQITNAVAYLHNLGVIHRDITPENIIITGNKVFLIDFGFATEFSPANPSLFSPMTVIPDERCIFSHPWLRPPEWRFCPSSDVFYIGLLGIFMLTGYLLIEKEKYFKDTYLKETLDFLPKLNPTVSNDFKEFLKKATSPKIELRYHNGEEMLRALEKIARHTLFKTKRK